MAGNGAMDEVELHRDSDADLEDIAHPFIDGHGGGNTLLAGGSASGDVEAGATLRARSAWGWLRHRATRIAWSVLIVAAIFAILVASAIAFGMMHNSGGTAHESSGEPMANDIPLQAMEWYDDPKLFTDVHSVAEESEWMQVMAEADFTAIEWFHAGLSTKYRAHLRGGYQVSLKPAFPEDDCASQTMFEEELWSEREAHELSRHRTPYCTRARREIQGAMEIAAYHMDRLLCLYRKPPIVGKNVPNHVFYAYNDTKRETTRRNMATYSIPTAIIPWVNELHHMKPTKQRFGSPLLMNTSMPHDAARFDLVLDVSDTLVFDYLVDDHDRLKSQNWEYGAGSPLLLWDSGLAWVHGPRGYSEGKEHSLLCGPQWWREEDSRACNSICRFSAELVSRVKTLVNGKGVGESLRASLAADELFPIFQYGLYYVRRPTEGNWEELTMVRLEQSEFFPGMDVKARRFLDIVDECITSYGREEVLLNRRLQPSPSQQQCMASE